MSAFVAVARNGGFAAAARSLGMSSTAVSRHVAQLEQSLGVTLLRRTTRSVTLTESGARYLPQAAAILEEIERLNAQTSANERKLQGSLRLSAPPGTASDLVVPLVLEFAETHADIDIELSLTERRVDLVAEGYDAAIRSGPLSDSRLIARQIATMRYGLFASPAYLRARGTPRLPDDIAQHDCLYWRSHYGDTPARWEFLRDGAEQSVPIRARLRISGMPALREAALCGLGIAMLPEVSLRDELHEGLLVPVLADYELPATPLYLVRPPARFETARLRALSDHLVRGFRERLAHPAQAGPAASPESGQD